MKEERNVIRIGRENPQDYAAAQLGQMKFVTYHYGSGYKKHVSEEVTRRAEPRRVCLQSTAIFEHYR